MKKDTKEQNYGFTKEEREKILKEKFKVSKCGKECEEKLLEDIIDGVINAIKDAIKDDDDYKKDDDDYKNCIRKYWFTKQIEEWKKNNKTNKEPSDDELMEIVREDLKIRIANTMLELKQELKKHKDIKEEGDIWFYRNDYNVALYHDDITRTCEVSDFIESFGYVSPPYKPFFMNNPNDHNNLNGVCIYKHGNDEKKTKWIMACFKNERTKPRCKITFQTNENNKITDVEIETEQDSNSGKSIYAIYLNEAGKVIIITTKGKLDVKKNYAEEIKQLLFEDKIIKVLRERIEDELDNQQKVVFDKIKEHLGNVEEKEAEKEDNTNIITKDINKDNSSCNCCGLDLSCLKSCTKVSFVEK